MTWSGVLALRRLANQCRCLARGASTAAARNCLNEMASGYEDDATRAEAREAPVPPAGPPGEI